MSDSNLDLQIIQSSIDRLLPSYGFSPSYSQIAFPSNTQNIFSGFVLTMASKTHACPPEPFFFVNISRLIYVVFSKEAFDSFQDGQFRELNSACKHALCAASCPEDLIPGSANTVFGMTKPSFALLMPFLVHGELNLFTESNIRNSLSKVKVDLSSMSKFALIADFLGNQGTYTTMRLTDKISFFDLELYNLSSKNYNFILVVKDTPDGYYHLFETKDFTFFLPDKSIDGDAAFQALFLANESLLVRQSVTQKDLTAWFTGHLRKDTHTDAKSGT